jgi:hypothetical protein
MNAGTILIEYRFPAHWPPKTPLVLVDNEDRGTRARLILSAAGRLELELHSGGAVDVHKFQTIRPTSPGYGRIAIAWGDGPPVLFMNGREVRSMQATGDEVLEIPLNPQPLPASGGFSIERDLLLRMSDEERLFLESLHDLERRLAGGTSYDLLMASGVLRKLLLDENPIAHQVNRHYRMPFVFEVLHPRSAPSIPATDPELQFDGLFPDGGTSRAVNEEQFWRHRILYHGNVDFTAREVVLAAAHVLGGVHLGKPKTESEHRMVDLAARIKAMNTPLPLHAVGDIALVVAAGLLPLANAIAKKYQG